MNADLTPATPIHQFKKLLDVAYSQGIRHVYFIDPDFGRPWSTGIEKKAIEYLGKLGFRWRLLTNVYTLQKYGNFMIDNGLSSFFIGIESLADSYAKTRNRLQTLHRFWQNQDKTIQLITKMDEKGILPIGLYILGNPGETFSAMRKGIQKLKQIVPLSQISTNQPFPGTAQFFKALKNG